MTKNRTPTPVYLDPGMHPGLEVKGLRQLPRFATPGRRNIVKTLKRHEDSTAYNNFYCCKKNVRY